jgi:hypothetical protein
VRGQHIEFQIQGRDQIMCKINCEEIVEGLIPSERVARIKSAEGRIEEVVVSEKMVAGKTISASFIGREADKVLVELPRETASGRWRVWLEKDQVGE